DTLVLVRTLAATPGKEIDSEHATLLVVRAWKGPYKKGDHIESYTKDIGGGLCDSPVPEFNPFLRMYTPACEHQLLASQHLHARWEARHAPVQGHTVAR